MIIRMALRGAILSLAVFGAGFANAQPVSQATQDALLHVVAHEIGHAMLREFDLPILGPEEDIADDFATVFIHQMMPERAASIVSARASQNLADDEGAAMFSEYRSDQQRVGRMICVLYGQDPNIYADLAAQFGLDGNEAANCRDFGSELGRSWRRVLRDYRMPEGARVTEIGLTVDPSEPLMQALAESAFGEDALRLLAAIDWHSRITLNLAQCDGTAGWSRNGRRITVCHAYVERFETQLTGG